MVPTIARLKRRVLRSSRRRMPEEFSFLPSRMRAKPRLSTLALSIFRMPSFSWASTLTRSSRLMPHFINPKVGAIAGNAKVGNRVNLWTRWQALEYITSQNFERRALDVLGAVSVVPGAIGAWRVSAVREAGGYHIDTVAEDADLTMALLRRGYRVEYEDMALAFTEGPTNANGLMRQRFRWSFGFLQAVYKHS